MANKLFIVLSSPSGGGKSTVAKHLMTMHSEIKFSVSATTRAMRTGETFGKDYYFLTKAEFVEKIENSELIEYEEIFGNYYGTLTSELQKAVDENYKLIFDVDVKGALSIKKAFPSESLLVFLAPPDMATLENRLRNRKTESEQQIAKRLSRAEMEIAESIKFDYVIVNKVLENTLKEAESIIKNEIYEN